MSLIFIFYKIMAIILLRLKREFMSIDYTTIKTGDDFELLCRDVLKFKGINILSEPSVGPDQGKDILIEVNSRDALGNQETLKYVVQCKHNAISNKSVRVDDIGDFRSVCDIHKADGYFLITSTMPATNLSSSFEAANQKGDYKCLIWDKQKLETEIENLDNSVEIIKKYNLKSDYENISSFINRILESETKLPFELVNKVEEKNIGGRIYQKLISDEPELEYELIGYFWTDENMDETLFKQTKSKYSLNDLYVITTDEFKTSFSMTLNDFYLHIQSYKDYWYQMGIVKLVGYAQTNPTVTHLINTLFASSVYPLQEPVINLFKDILKISSVHNKKIDTFVIQAICNAISKHELHEFKQNIFEFLIIIPLMRKFFESDKPYLMHLDTMTEFILKSFTTLELKNSEFSENIADLFNNVEDIEFKLLLLPYLKAFNIDRFDKELHKIKKENGSQVVTAHLNAVSHGKTGIWLIENKVEYTIKRVIDEYFEINKDSYGSMIYYDFFGKKY